MNLFLRMKSWQVFGIVVGLPFVFQSVFMVKIMSSNTIEPRALFDVFPYMMLGFVIIFMTWFWSLGTGLNNIVKREIRPSSRLFRFGIAFSAIYMILFTFYMGRFIEMEEQKELGSMMGIIFPLHLISMFFMFYGLHFIARNLVMAEKNEVVKFDDFSGPFFLIWFFPIGIWFVQPRINKLISNHDT